MRTGARPWFQVAWGHLGRTGMAADAGNKGWSVPRAFLEKLRIIEIAGVGSSPFAGMMLVDHRAEVIRVDRPWPPSAYRDPLPLDRG
jgi:hypothetical protein